MKMLMTRPRISSGAASCASEIAVDVTMISATLRDEQQGIGDAPASAPSAKAISSSPTSPPSTSAWRPMCGARPRQATMPAPSTAPAPEQIIRWL